MIVAGYSGLFPTTNCNYTFGSRKCSC